MGSNNSSPKDLLQFFLSQYPNASRLPDMNSWIQMQGRRKPAGDLGDNADSFQATEEDGLPSDEVLEAPTEEDIQGMEQNIREMRMRLGHGGGAGAPSGLEKPTPIPAPTPSPTAIQGVAGPTNYHIDMKPSYDSQGHRSWSIKQIFEGK